MATNICIGAESNARVCITEFMGPTGAQENREARENANTIPPHNSQTPQLVLIQTCPSTSLASRCIDRAAKVGKGERSLPILQTAYAYTRHNTTEE